MVLGFLVSGALLCGNVSAATYFWYSTTRGDWALFSDPASWRTDTFGGTAVATTVPGSGDIISGKGGSGEEVPRYAIDLGGQSWTVGNIGSDMNGWGNGRTFDLTNGTLVTTGGFRGRYTTLDIWADTKLAMPATAIFQPNDNHNSKSTVRVHEGGELEAPGPLYFFGPNDILIAAGAKATFGSSFRQNSWGTTYLTSVIENAGELVLPGGLAWASVGSYGTAYQTTILRQKDGTLSLGGPLTQSGLDGVFQAEFSGGELVVTGGNVSFSGLDSAAVAAGITLPVSVAAGASVSFSGVTIGAEATIVKRGAGALNVDGSLPTGVQVVEGPVWITVPNLTLNNLDVVSGTEVVFKSYGTRMDALANADTLSFSVDTTQLLSGQVVLRSADAALLTVVSERMSLPPGFSLKVVSDALVLFEAVPNTFDATLSSDLSNAAAWGGTIPASDQDVVIVGNASETDYSWVEFNASSPKFRSITLRESAGLRVAGGTAAEPVDLPLLHEQLHTKVRVEEDAYVTLTNGLENTATADALPVFEIATNAIVKVPGALKGGSASYSTWGYVFVPGTMCFRNVDLRLYGTIELPEVYTMGSSYVTERETSSANKGYSRIIFGWADANETTYFAMTAIGGTVKVNDGTTQYEGNHSRIEFASAMSGGRVKVVGDILLRDFAKDTSPQSGTRANSGYYFGAYNPADEVFNVILDHSELRPTGPSFIGGGTQLLLRNGAVWSPRPTDIEFTHTHGIAVAHAATITLDGPDTLFSRPHYNQYSSYAGVDNPYGSLWRNFMFAGTGVAGSPRVTLRNGAAMNVWDFYCYGLRGESYAQIEGGFWNVDKPCGINNDAARSYTERAAIFSGFSRVNIAANSTFTVRATDDWPDRRLSDADRAVYPDWQMEVPRVAWLEIPVTGEGNLSVTNALPAEKSEYAMTLLVTNGVNVATGMASAITGENGGASYLVFADGAKWAGSVVANGNASLTNLVNATAPAKATFGGISFSGTFPIRLWVDGQSDFIELTGDCTAVSGGLAGVGMADYVPQPGDAFVVARCPATASLPKAARGWKVRAVADPEDAEKVLVTLVCAPSGTQIMLR
ncbi:MAG: hypothetical protein MJ240_04040 [Kiritimatiellae bacterium]|nr:hypothetical protein [Kiritimatiellia bacterium]